jgi:acetyltransferase
VTAFDPPATAPATPPLERTIEGQRVRFRPIAPADAPRLVAGLDFLSAETRLARFFFIKSGFTPAELHHLTHCDGRLHVGWVADLPDAADQPLLGVARWLRPDAAATAAEVAFVVRDDWQHHGIGTTLLGILSRTARALGVTHFRSQVLAGNLASENLMEHIGTLEARSPFGDGAFELLYRLDA